MVIETVIGWLFDYKYLAMFGLLVLCGLGLPLPEEVTLIGSGLLVGWDEAHFLQASIACVCGILCGDTIIYGLGRHFGQHLLDSRFMCFLLSQKRQQRVQQFFARYGSKALFAARFFPGVRIGVYAYAGAQKVPWWRFFLLDFAGTLLSGPTSIFIGAKAARAFAQDRDEAIRMATATSHRFGLVIAGVALLVTLGLVVLPMLLRKRRQVAPVTMMRAESTGNCKPKSVA